MNLLPANWQNMPSIELRTAIQIQISQTRKQVICADGGTKGLAKPSTDWISSLFRCTCQGWSPSALQSFFYVIFDSFLNPPANQQEQKTEKKNRIKTYVCKRYTMNWVNSDSGNAFRFFISSMRQLASFIFPNDKYLSGKHRLLESKTYIAY